ncbi:YraN family protein [soil metagenome]
MTHTTTTPGSGHTPTTAASRQALGAYGEKVAERYLSERGLVVLDRNWRCDEGEIDLVLREGHVLVVCEVKTRRGALGGTPHEAITDVKLERLQRLGWRWARDRGLNPTDLRVDLVAIMRPRRGAALVDHVRSIG